MSIKLSTAQLWVDDQDEALAFYTDKVGLEVRSDVTLPELGDFRWLTVGPPNQPDIAIVLMAIPGPPVMDAETAEQVRSLMSQGLRRHDLPDDGGLPGVLRGAQGPRGRVLRGADGVPLRHRLGVPRPVREQHPADPGHDGRRVGTTGARPRARLLWVWPLRFGGPRASP